MICGELQATLVEVFLSARQRRIVGVTEAEVSQVEEIAQQEDVD